LKENDYYKEFEVLRALKSAGFHGNYSIITKQLNKIIGFVELIESQEIYSDIQ
jgi:hypothetical protein